MVHPKYSPEEALQRVKLMMGYDTKKTLKENIESTGSVLNEQEAAQTTDKQATASQTTAGQASNIASKLWGYMAGDVETEDLDKVQQLFNSEVFGKPFKDGCLLEKVLEYYKGHQGEATWSWGTTYHEGGFMDDLDHSDEAGEPEFVDVKQDLKDSIQKELNGFCKTSKKQETTTTVDCQKTPNDPKCKKTTNTGGSYTVCTGTYKYTCKTDPSGAIGKVQACLGLVQDGKFGPKTRNALSAKGFTTFTDADVETICNKPTPTPTAVVTPGESGVEDVNNV